MAVAATMPADLHSVSSFLVDLLEYDLLLRIHELWLTVFEVVDAVLINKPLKLANIVLIKYHSFLEVAEVA